MTRLQSVAPELVSKLRSATPSLQRTAALVACEFAVAHSDVENQLVIDALQNMRASRPIAPEQRSSIEALVAQLDEAYLDLKKDADEGVGTFEYMQAFGRARAAAAIFFAAQKDPFQASTEAIYEAAATTDKPEELFFQIIDAVRNDKPIGPSSLPSPEAEP